MYSIKTIVKKRCSVLMQTFLHELKHFVRVNAWTLENPPSPLDSRGSFKVKNKHLGAPIN